MIDQKRIPTISKVLFLKQHTPKMNSGKACKNSIARIHVVCNRCSNKTSLLPDGQKGRFVGIDCGF